MCSSTGGVHYGLKVNAQLAEDQYATLKMWISSGKTEQRLVNRTRIILRALVA
jgi:hypothetical protein